MKPTLLVLAAGIGSRYGGLKQLDPIGPNGEIIIDYSIFDAIRAGFGKIVFVIRRDIEKDFREIIGRRYEKNIDVRYAFQEINNLPEGFSVPAGREKPWGTAHAILTAEPEIEEAFAVINADDFYGRTGYQLLKQRLVNTTDSTVAEYCMVGFILRQTLSEHGHVSRGICETDEKDYLVDVVERTNIVKINDAAEFISPDGVQQRLSGDEMVSMNMWGFTPSIFSHLKRQFPAFLEKSGAEMKSEFFIPTVVNSLIKEGLARVKVMPSGDRWFGVTYREDKAAVEAGIRKLIARDEYPGKLQ